MVHDFSFVFVTGKIQIWRSEWREGFVLHHKFYTAEIEDYDDLNDNVPIDLGVWILGLQLVVLFA